MIKLKDIAKKLENVLNGNDETVVELGLDRFSGFYFKVATEGFHIDNITDIPEGLNFIPVFVSKMGGNYNPVPDLKQANLVIPIAIYFPVRFKDQLDGLEDYLAEVFVGRELSYGGKLALSNISIGQYGEIVDTDLKQFAEWERTIYKRSIEIMEPFLQMNLSLYLSIVGDGFVYGNSYKATLEFIDSDFTFKEDLVLAQGSIQSHSDPAAQQLLDATPAESEGLPTATSYGSSFSAYVKNSAFFKRIIKKYYEGNIQLLEFTLKMTFLGQTYQKTVFMQSLNMPIQYGELATITFAFSKKADVDNGGL